MDEEAVIPKRKQNPSKAAYIKAGPKIKKKLEDDTLPEKFKKFFRKGPGSQFADTKDGGIIFKNWEDAILPHESNNEIDVENVQLFAEFAVYADGLNEPLTSLAVEDAKKELPEPKGIKL